MVSSFPTEDDMPVTGFEGAALSVRLTRNEAQKQVEMLTAIPYFRSKGRPKATESTKPSNQVLSHNYCTRGAKRMFKANSVYNVFTLTLSIFTA